jgi:hypothetical protein
MLLIGLVALCVLILSVAKEEELVQCGGNRNAV